MKYVKKALITVKLVPEASKFSNDQIETEIHDNSNISWCAQIEKVEIIKQTESEILQSIVKR